MRARLCLAAILVVLAGSPAWAHASLVEATPADGAALAEAPDAVVLRFDEAVEPIALRVIDARGAVVAEAVPPAGDSLRLALPAGLAQGSYLVSYRVVSADAHPIGGAILFTIGTPSAQAPPRDLAQSREAAWRSSTMVVRGLRDASLLFAIGGALFVALVLARGDPLAVRLTPALRLAGVIAIVLSVAGVFVVGGLAVLAPATAILERATWAAGLATSAAPAAIATIAGTLLASASLPARTPPARALVLLGAMLAAAGTALTGHAATAGPTVQALHAAHVLAAAFWLGALWPLLALARAGDDAATARAARRFALGAGVGVAALVVAGVWLALAQAGWALLGSLYGRLVGAKILVLLTLLVVAASNRWRLVPRLAAPSGSAQGADIRRADARPAPIRRALIGNLRLDLALGALVLAITAVLVHTPPQGFDRLAPAGDAHPAHEEIAGPVIVAASGTRTMTVEVTPGVAGRNTITLSFAGADGSAFVPRAVRVELALQAAGIEPIVRDARSAGDGRFRISGPELALAGRWTVGVEALIDDFEKAVFSAQVTIR